MPLYGKLPTKLRQELHGHINVFLKEKDFIGRADLTITDEIRVIVAGNACLLLLNRKPSYFVGFSSILIYPDTYVAKEVTSDGVVEIQRDSVRLGESWHRGPIVLSWQDVLEGISDPADGRNVVIHEFAHKLDEENCNVDGLPILMDDDHYREWADVLSKEYEALADRAEAGKNEVLDEYGLTSPAEFFAVATESFFEKPQMMRERLPDLYRQLRKFYAVDPATWGV